MEAERSKERHRSLSTLARPKSYAGEAERNAILMTAVLFQNIRFLKYMFHVDIF